ncbi:MAG: hypothetical protein ABSA81_10350 [Candidatus Bathyarchaeia archaeon]
MTLRVLENTPIRFVREDILKIRGMARFSKMGSLDELIEQSRKLVEPRAVYTFIDIEELKEDGVLLRNGEFLQSPLLSSKITCASEVAPYIVTIGARLEAEVTSLARNRILESFILDKLGTYALIEFGDRLRRTVEQERKYNASSFSPGDTPSWNVEELRTLFKILSPQKVKEEIGVELKESGMMFPKKSGAGVTAATLEDYWNCQVCTDQRCEHRECKEAIRTRKKPQDSH